MQVAKFLIQAGVHAHMVDDDGMTPLLWATKRGHTEVACLLLKAKASVDFVANNAKGRSALGVASARGDVGFMQLLLGAGASKDLADQRGITALMRACAEGHAEAARLLLDMAADPNVPDLQGKTALMKAAGQGSLDLAHLLLDAAADREMADYKGRTAYTYAKAQGHFEVADLVADKRHCHSAAHLVLPFLCSLVLL